MRLARIRHPVYPSAHEGELQETPALFAGPQAHSDKARTRMCLHTIGWARRLAFGFGRPLSSVLNTDYSRAMMPFGVGL